MQYHDSGVGSRVGNVEEKSAEEQDGVAPVGPRLTYMYCVETNLGDDIGMINNGVFGRRRAIPTCCPSRAE